MTKYRIAIQKVNPKYQHIHNITLETDDEEAMILRIRAILHEEIKTREENTKRWLEIRSYINKQIKNKNIDWKAKGKDISRKEFLRNEIDMTMREGR